MTENLHETLRARLDSQSATAPPAPALGEILDQCERSLTRRRRRMAVGATTLAVAAAAAAVVVPFSLGGLGDQSTVADGGTVTGMSTDAAGDAAAAPTDEAIVETCRNGSQARYTTDLVFDSGTPKVAARMSPPVNLPTVVLVSADGQYWAKCTNAFNTSSNSPEALADEPGRPNMTVYEAKPTTNRITYTVVDCQVGTRNSACNTSQNDGPSFIIDYVDRLPAEVAYVEFTTADEQTTRVKVTSDGFVMFGYRGVLPSDYNSGTGMIYWLSQINYLDANDQPVAADRLTGEGFEVDGLPTLDAYPSISQPAPTTAG